MTLYARLEEGRKPSDSELAKGKKPSDVSWKNWLQAGGSYKGKTKKPKKPKRLGQSPEGSFHDPYKSSKKAKKKKKSKSSSNWFDAMTKGMDSFDFFDEPDDKYKPYKPKPIKRTPEEEKLYKITKSLGTIPRTAAGGIVFKTFEGPDFWELPVLVSQVAPKWGSYWVFPKGGLDLGEHIYKGAAREVYEEAGVKAKVVSPLAYKSMSRFGERGKYDLALVMDLLKKKNPKDKAFIEANKEKIKNSSFSYANHSHYFIMIHKGGKPRQTIGKDEEMARSEWVPLREAVKRAKRGKAVVKFLTPVMFKMWKPSKGVVKPSKAPKPFKSKPKDRSRKSSSSSPWKSYKPKGGKDKGGGISGPPKSYGLFY